MITGIARTGIAIALLLLMHGGLADEQRTATTKRNAFVVSYESDLKPLAINRIHSWMLHVETTDGEVVEDADITLIGGMPDHDHGLPTLPRATRYIGGGDYLVEGMKFHMNGWWQITIRIDAGTAIDSVIFDLQL